MRRLVVGIVQSNFADLPTKNFDKVSRLILNSYRDADIVVLPEYSMVNVLILKDPAKVYELAESIHNSGYLQGFYKLANELNTAFVVHFIEKTNRPPLMRSTTLFVSLNDAVPVYSKMHLFDAYGFKESAFFEPGREPSKIIEVKSFRIAFAICYDIRFPELFRFYAFSGAHMVIVQAAWVKNNLKEQTIDILATARAHENTLYIVLANQVGDLFTGRSGVYNPWGFKELDIGFREGYVEYEIDLEEVEKARKTIPVVKQAMDKWVIDLKRFK